MLLKSFIRPASPWYLNQVKSYTNTERKWQSNITGEHKCENYNKMFANWIQQYSKMIKHDDKLRCISRMQGWFNIHKSLNQSHCTKNLKNKNHVLISIDSEKAFDKIWHSFMRKSSINMGTCLKIIEAYMISPGPNIILSDENFS